MASLNTKLATTPNVSANYVLKATTSTTIGNSLIFDNGTNTAIGGTTITDGNLLNIIGNQSSVNVGLVLNNTNGTYPKIYGIQNVNSNLVFYDYSANATRLTINSTGDATFTGNATANGVTIGASDIRSSSNVLTLGGTSEVMRIIGSTGNVGIGTNSPSERLHLYSSASSVEIRMQNNTISSYIRSASDNLNFYVSNGEKMRITTETGTANVCIGTTSSPQANAGRGALTINGTSTSILTMAIGGAEKGYVYHNASEINLVNSTPGRLYCIAYTGGVYLNSGATSWTANSDERLKDITGNIENAVDSLMTLRAVKHTWKADEDKVEKLALIAQDVEKVFPQVVDKGKLPSKPNEEQTDETEYLGVRYQELIPVLVKAIQELNQKVNDQQQTINSLINR